MKPLLHKVIPAVTVLAVTALPAVAQPSPGNTYQDQDRAHRILAALSPSLTSEIAGRWLDPATGDLVVAVTDRATADRAEKAGARTRLVSRSKTELDALKGAVARYAGNHVPGLRSFGVDDPGNRVVVSVDRTRATKDTERFLGKVRALGNGVVIETATGSFRQQAGDVRPGSPWWPGAESNCSIGFPAMDAQGGKHFVTAGHCTNDANQAAYGQSGQQNRIGTSNVGGSRSVNAREGDMGVVAVTEPGWNLSASVNTWGQPPVTVTGSAEAIVGDSVCHSGNTAPNWECGRVRAVNQSIDYGTTIVDGLTTTDACSEGGDSGGAWLRGDKAVGLHSGGQSSCGTNQDNSTFQPVNEALAKWNLTLFTGSGNPADTQAPSVPADPAVTATTANSVSLSWTASTDNIGVTGYDVYNGTTLATSVGGTTATVTGLAADTAYSFRIVANDAAGNRSAQSAAVSARTQPGGGTNRTFGNGTDYPIRDFAVAISTVRSTATGRAASPMTVRVTASHTCLQDLTIRVVSPSGWSYYLQQAGGSTCTPFGGTRTWSVTPIAENAAGTWTLRIGDNGPGDTGVLDTWSITL